MAEEAESWIVPAEALRQADGLPEPVQHAGFHLGGGGRGLPEHALRAERGRQHLRQHRGRARIGREIGEEARMLPVGHARHHDTLEVREHGFHRFARLGWRRGQGGGDVARAGLRADGQALHPGHVVGHPVHEAVGVGPEFFGRHETGRSGAIDSGGSIGVIVSGSEIDRMSMA